MTNIIWNNNLNRSFTAVKHTLQDKIAATAAKENEKLNYRVVYRNLKNIIIEYFEIEN